VAWSGALSAGDLRRITRHFEGDYKEFEIASPQKSPQMVKEVDLIVFRADVDCFGLFHFDDGSTGARK
jgi:hypothetical protein